MKRKRGEYTTLKSIPSDILKIIISLVPFDKTNWIDLRLVSKKFLALCKQVQDPSVDDGKAIVWACENGHLEGVKSLLQDPRVDPSVRFQRPLRGAVYYGRSDVVKLLLSQEKVDPYYVHSTKTLKGSILDAPGMFGASVGYLAFESEDHDTIAAILNDKRSSVGGVCNDILHKAVSLKHWDLVGLLVIHPHYEMDPVAEDSAIRRACQKNKDPHVIRGLLEHLNPSMATLKTLLKHKSSKGQSKCVEELLYNPKTKDVWDSRCLGTAFKEASKRIFWDTCKVLLVHRKTFGQKFWDLESCSLLTEEAALMGYHDFFELMTTQDEAKYLQLPRTTRDILFFSPDPRIVIWTLKTLGTNTRSIASLVIHACQFGLFDLAGALTRELGFSSEHRLPDSQ
jgi:hypothetical protein